MLKSGMARLRYPLLMLSYDSQGCVQRLTGRECILQCAYVRLPGVEGGNGKAEAVGVDNFAVPVEIAVTCSCLVPFCTNTER